MSTQVANFNKAGDLKVKGLNTRLPAELDNLVFSLPFDGTTKGAVVPYILAIPDERTIDDFTTSMMTGAKAGTYNCIVQEADIYIDEYPPSSYSCIIRNNLDGDTTGINMYINLNGKVVVQHTGKRYAIWFTSKRVLTRKRWYTVTHISTKTSTMIYINGHQDTKVPNSSTTDFMITTNYHSGNDSNDRLFNGRIKNVKVGCFDIIPDVDNNVQLTNDGACIVKRAINYAPSMKYADIVDFYPTGIGWDDSKHQGAVLVDGWNSGYNESMPMASERYHAYFRVGYVNGKKMPIATFYEYNYELLGQVAAKFRWMGLSAPVPDKTIFTNGLNVTVTWKQRTNTLTKGGQISLYHYLISTGLQDHGNAKSPVRYNTKSNTWEIQKYTFQVSDWDNTKSTDLYLYGFESGSGLVEIADVKITIDNRSIIWEADDTVANSELAYNFPSVNTSEGTILFEASSLYDLQPEATGDGDRSFISLYDIGGTTNVQRAIYLNDGDKAYKVWNGSDLGGPDNLTWPALENHKWGYSWGPAGEKLYLDGIKVVHATSYTATLSANLMRIGRRLSAGGDNSADICIKNLLYYDKQLEDMKVADIHGINPLSVNKFDQLVAPISNFPKNLSNHAKYFPFSDTIRDYSGLLRPLEEDSSKLRFEDGYMYCGNGYGNRLTNLDFTNIGSDWFISVNTTNVNTEYTNLMTPYGPGAHFKFTRTAANAGANNWIGIYPTSTQLEEIATGPKTVSTMIFPIKSIQLSGDGDHLYRFRAAGHLNDYQNETSSGGLHYIKPGYWHRLITTREDFGADEGVSQTRYWELYSPSLMNEGDTWEFIIAQPQVISNNHYIPYTDSSSNEGTIVNLPYDILDWSKDFTIYGEFKPQKELDSAYSSILNINKNPGGSYGETGGYRLLIMRDLSGVLKMWVGNAGIEYGPTTTLTTKTKEWNFFALIRSGADLKLVLGTDSGFEIKSLAGYAQYVPSEMDPTQYKVSIGDYNGLRAEAYFRNFVFVQEAITDTKIREIFEEKFNFSEDGINIKGNLQSDHHDL